MKEVADRNTKVYNTHTAMQIKTSYNNILNYTGTSTNIQNRNMVRMNK